MKWYLALGFFLALQMIMFLAQAQITDMAGNYTISETVNEQYETMGGDNYTLTGDVVDFMPSPAGSVDESSGEVFTDSYRTGTSWLQSGKNSNFLTAPYNMMADLGFGKQTSFAIAVFWYLFMGAITLYQFLRGGA